MNDESGESMEPIHGRSATHKPRRVRNGKNSAWLTEGSRELIPETIEGKHTGRNDLLFAEKVM